MIEVTLLRATLRVFQNAGRAEKLQLTSPQAALCLRLEMFTSDVLSIAVRRSKRARAPSIKLVYSDPMRIRIDIESAILPAR